MTKHCAPVSPPFSQPPPPCEGFPNQASHVSSHHHQPESIQQPSAWYQNQSLSATSPKNPPPHAPPAAVPPTSPSGKPVHPLHPAPEAVAKTAAPLRKHAKPALSSKTSAPLYSPGLSAPASLSSSARLVSQPAMSSAKRLPTLRSSGSLARREAKPGAVGRKLLRA